MSIKKISELNIIDLEYRQQNDRIAENANRNRIGNVVKAPLNRIQNEMVADFKAIYGKPKEIKDNAGNIIKYKLYDMPREEPNIELNEKNLRTDEEIKNEFNNIIDELHREYTKIYDDSMIIIDEDYNDIKLKTEYDIINFKKDINKLKNDNKIHLDEIQILYDKIKNTTDKIEIMGFETEILDLKNKILLNNTKITQYENDIEKENINLGNEYNQ